MKYLQTILVFSLFCLVSGCSSGPSKDVLQKVVENRYLQSSDNKFNISKVTVVSSDNKTEDLMGYKTDYANVVVNASLSAKVDCLAEKPTKEITYPPNCVTKAEYETRTAQLKDSTTEAVRKVAATNDVGTYDRAKAQGGMEIKAGDELVIKNIAISCYSDRNQKPSKWNCKPSR